MSRNKYILTEIVSVAVTVAAIFWIIAILAHQAHGGEIVTCRASPGGGNSYWFWREIDGRHCWFPRAPGIERGTDKPKSELRWAAKTVTDAPVVTPPPPAEPDQPAPWEQEERWWLR